MLYYPISTKAVRHFCRTALLFRLYLNRLHTRDILLQPQEIRFIEMPRHGDKQHDFYRVALLPQPIAMPTPVVVHRPAAVIRPITPPRCTKITPAPRKPIPAAMLAATRETSTETPAAPTIGRKPYEETSVISAVPSETIMCTRTGAFHACLPLRNDQPQQTDHLNIFRRTQAPSE